jgi:hypothetical protein
LEELADQVMEQQGPEAEELQDIFQKLDSFGSPLLSCLSCASGRLALSSLPCFSALSSLLSSLCSVRSASDETSKIQQTTVFEETHRSYGSLMQHTRSTLQHPLTPLQHPYNTLPALL